MTERWGYEKTGEVMEGFVRNHYIGRRLPFRIRLAGLSLAFIWHSDFGRCFRKLPLFLLRIELYKKTIG